MSTTGVRWGCLWSGVVLSADSVGIHASGSSSDISTNSSACMRATSFRGSQAVGEITVPAGAGTTLPVTVTIAVPSGCLSGVTYNDLVVADAPDYVTCNDSVVANAPDYVTYKLRWWPMHRLCDLQRFGGGRCTRLCDAPCFGGGRCPRLCDVQ